MKYAMITPVRPGMRTLVASYNLGYHMLLPQMFTDEAYVDFYKDARDRGHFLMLDNGAAENAGVPFAEVVRFGNLLNVDEIVMPDALRDMQGTLSLWYKHEWMVVPPKQRCFIPQGDTVAEWIECLEILMKQDWLFSAIGVPKHLERHDSGRYQVLSYIKNKGYDRTHHIHLFGVYNSAKDEIELASKVSVRIRGIDSGCVVGFAQAGRNLYDAGHYGVDLKGGFPVADVATNLSQMLMFCAQAEKQWQAK